MVQKPGSITPHTYERRTGDEALETQATVDQRLKDLWNACFPEEKLS